MSTPNIEYEEDVKKVLIGKKEVVVVNRTPIYSPEERERVKEEINRKLYDVFKKYM